MEPLTALTKVLVLLALLTLGWGSYCLGRIDQILSRYKPGSKKTGEVPPK